MSDIFIHVGIQKTGSTFLQREVFRKIKNIHLYGMGNKLIKFNSDLPKDGKPILISCETYAGNPFSPYVSKERYDIAKELHRYFPNARIIVVFREKNAWVKSLYSEYIKMGGAKKYDFWYNNLFKKEYLDFEGYEKLLRELFKDVLVLNHKDLRQKPDYFIKKICDYMNVNITKYNKNAKWGKKFSEGQLNFFRFINKFFKFNMNREDGFLPAFLSPLYIYRRYLDKY